MEKSQALQPGTLLKGGRYKINHIIGQGGFGITYEAVDIHQGDEKVCIKEFFFRQHCDRDATLTVTVKNSSSVDVVNKFRTKFFEEAKSIAGFNHAHIIHVRDYFQENQTAYYVMNYIEGTALSIRLRRPDPDNPGEFIKTRMKEEDALRVVHQIGAALKFLHKRKVNHLDIKPANILIDSEDMAYLIDFGTAKNHSIEHSDDYSSPTCVSGGYSPIEQYTKGGVDEFSPTADIYSLGATLYRMLSGQTPPEPVHINERHPLPELPPDISAETRNAVKKAMKKNKWERFATIDEFLNALPATDEIFDVVLEDYGIDVIVGEEEIDQNNPAAGGTNPANPTNSYQSAAFSATNVTSGTQHQPATGGNVGPTPSRPQQQHPYKQPVQPQPQQQSHFLVLICVFVGVLVLSFMIVFLSQLGKTTPTEEQYYEPVDTTYEVPY